MRHKRSILLWAPQFAGFGGGISAFSRELACALAASGADLRLFGKLDECGVWNGLPLCGVSVLPSCLRTPSFAVLGLMGAFLHRPDWIVSTHLNFGPVAHMAKRLAGCRYALTGHGVDVHAGLSPARLAALRSADMLIAVSEWTRQRLLGLGGIAPEKIRVLPNTFDNSIFSVGQFPRHLVERYGLEQGEKVILTVARLDAGEGYKGYDRILEALPAIRSAVGNVRYLIVGKGGDLPRLEEMCKRLKLEKSVTFAGFVPDDELADHYRLADVFAMPSTGEGFGIVFLEAMACGTPVLGGDQDGSVDALDGGRLGMLVDPTSVDAIADGLISLLRQQGPAMWFERKSLASAVEATYGRDAFRRRVAELFPGA